MTLTPDTETRLRTVAEERGLDPAQLHEDLLQRALAEAENGIVTSQNGARIAGTRIKVSQIALEHTREGLTPEQIVEAHPHLSAAQVDAALAYYYSHKEAVEAQIKAAFDYADEARRKAGPSPLAARLRAEGRLPAQDRAA